MYELTPERTFDSQTKWVINVLGLLIICFDILFNVVCTTRYRLTSGRLVHELNVCTECFVLLLLLSSLFQFLDLYKRFVSYTVFPRQR